MEILNLPFMQHAIIAGILSSIACGIMGSLVVVNRSVFLAGGIAHAAYGGVGLAFFLALPPLPCIIGFSTFMAFLIGALTLRKRQRLDAMIGVLWALGMAIGIILTDLTPGYNVDLMSFLFGSILTVPRSDLIVMFLVDAFVIGTVIYFYKEFLAISHDFEFSKVRGVKVAPLHLLFLVLVALCVVITIRVVGLILIMALFSIAPYISERYSSSLFDMMIKSIILNLFFVFLGLYLSYRFDLTSGATIILVAGIFFFLVFGFETCLSFFKGSRFYGGLSDG